MSHKAVSMLMDYLLESDDGYEGRPIELSALVAETRSVSQASSETLPVVEVSDAEIAAYLDRLLDPSELEAFEAKLVASRELRRRVASLAHLMESLFSGREPSADSIPSGAGGATYHSIEDLRETFIQGRSLTQAQHRELFRNPSYRAEYNRLIRSERLKPPPFDNEAVGFSGIAMPAQYAASSDKAVKDRAFEGGSIHIGSAGRPHLVQINIRIDKFPFIANQLELSGADGVCAYLALPPPDDTGEITRIIDLNNESDALAVELLRDPRTKGWFQAM